MRAHAVHSGAEASVVTCTLVAEIKVSHMMYNNLMKPKLKDVWPRQWG